MSLSLSDLDDCGTLLSLEYPDFQLHDKILTPEPEEPIAEVRLQEKCALPELVDIPPLLEPKTPHTGNEQECERWWQGLSKEQQQEVEHFLSEREKQPQTSSTSHSQARAAKRSSSFSSSASSFFSSYSTAFISNTTTSPLRRSSASSLSYLLSAASSSPPNSSTFPSPPRCSLLFPSLSIPITEQQCNWVTLHLSSPTRQEEKQMETWWNSLTVNKRQHIEKFIADAHEANPNCTEKALFASTKKFSLSESQYYWVLFRLNHFEQEEKVEAVPEQRASLECDPDLSGKHFFKNGHTFHASTTVKLLGPAIIRVVRRVDREKLHLTKSGNNCIRVDQPGQFTVFLRDFRLNLNNVKAQFRVEAEMCGRVFVTGWCTVHPRPPPSKKLAAQAAAGSSSEGTPTKRRKRVAEQTAVYAVQTPPRLSRTSCINDLIDLNSPPKLGKKQQSALQFLSNVAVDQLEGH